MSIIIIVKTGATIIASYVQNYSKIHESSNKLQVIQSGWSGCSD